MYMQYPKINKDYGLVCKTILIVSKALSVSPLDCGYRGEEVTCSNPYKSANLLNSTESTMDYYCLCGCPICHDS